MIEIDSTIQIDRPVEEVFAFASDVSNFPRWNPEVLHARQATDGPIEVGTKFDVKFKPFMGASACSMNVSAHEINRRQELEGSPISAIQAHATMTFEPIGTATSVTRHTRMDVNGWMWLMQPIMRIRLRKGDAHMLSRLRDVLESVRPS